MRRGPKKGALTLFLPPARPAQGAEVTKDGRRQLAGLLGGGRGKLAFGSCP